MNEPINVMRQSPTEREAGKTRNERAEDVAYTLNHAISCGMTDTLIAPTISALFGVQVGCSDPTHHHGPHEHHDHGHAHHEHHEHHAHDHTHTHEPVHAPHVKKPGWKNLNWKLYRSEAWHYFRGEIIGDVAAVPLTILVQRLFPSFMQGIQRAAEPVAAPLFHRGAEATARRWGAREGLAADDPQIVARAQQMYQTEMKHLPQVAVWNVFAFTIGTFSQRMGGHGSSYARIIRNKTLGALISNGILLSGRALAPNMAERWDALNGQHVIAPVTNAIGRLFGVQATPTRLVTEVQHIANEKSPASLQGFSSSPSLH